MQSIQAPPTDCTVELSMPIHENDPVTNNGQSEMPVWELNTKKNVRKMNTCSFVRGCNVFTVLYIDLNSLDFVPFSLKGRKMSS